MVDFHTASPQYKMFVVSTFLYLRVILFYALLYCGIQYTTLFTPLSYSAFTLNSAYNEKKYAEILLRYRRLFVKGNVFISERGIFGAEVFLRYRRFFVKSNFRQLDLKITK